MPEYKLERLWLDGYTPVPNLRGKTQVKECDSFPKLEQSPFWSFGGSSIKEAEGKNSDFALKPVAVYPDGARKNGALAACEVVTPDGVAPHPSNARATILDDPDAWFGFEQEYFLYRDGRPLGFPEHGFPAPQDPFCASVGYKNVDDIARQVVEEHLDLYLEAGVNAEVAKGQWEFQIFGEGSKKAADEIWMARYIFQWLDEKDGVDVEHQCKPLGDTNWNGSGVHAIFSTEYIREKGGRDYFEKLMAAFYKSKADDIAAHGPDNHLRLTSLREKASIDAFSYGVADRGASIRIPHSFINNDYGGYLEDRRHNSKGGYPPDRLADPQNHRHRAHTVISTRANLDRFPTRRNRLVDKKSLQVQKSGARSNRKSLSTFSDFALAFHLRSRSLSLFGAAAFVFRLGRLSHGRSMDFEFERFSIRSKSTIILVFALNSINYGRRTPSRHGNFSRGAKFRQMLLAARSLTRGAAALGRRRPGLAREGKVNEKN